MINLIAFRKQIRTVLVVCMFIMSGGIVRLFMGNVSLPELVVLRPQERSRLAVCVLAKDAGA